MEEGPEPQEWVERAAEEHHHAHEHGHAGGDGARPAATRSAVTAAVLAVLAALGSLLSGQAANEAILAQSRATNQWAYFQAKSTKGHLYEVGGEIVKALGGAPGHPGATVETFRAEAARYDGEKGEVRRGAERLEAESRHELHTHHRYALGVSMFQVGIVLASVSILVRYPPLYALSLAAGAGGLLCVVLGLVS